MYADRFWKKNWDEGVKDLEPNEFETTYVKLIDQAFKEVPDKTAMGYLGVDITFGEDPRPRGEGKKSKELQLGETSC